MVSLGFPPPSILALTDGLARELILLRQVAMSAPINHTLPTT